MNNVPLINNLTVNDINTALIAIKKNLVKGSNGNEQLQDVDVNVDVNIAQNCTYCAADSTTIKGAELFQGCSIKVLFTSAITGSNTTSPLTINYNNVDITVKVGKNGALADFVAYNTGSGYVYCQAYTTLELLFDGNNFVIMGNPVVISNSDYTVYTDGSITYTKKGFQKITVARYNSDDNANILLRACAEFGIGGQTWVTIRVTCVSYTNGSVWYQYILRFYYVSATTTFQQLFKIGGVSDITDWNDYGTIISNMDDQNPHYCIELLETV